MKLDQLMEIHLHETSQQALSQNWGDGYLYRHNKIFKNIRDQAIKLGFTFDSNPNSDFLVFPFAQLEFILENKKIPYLNNVDAVQSILNRTNHQAKWVELSDGFRRNFIFHESCHAVSRSLKDQYFQSNEKLIRILYEESFANTCELMGVIDVNDSAHQFFYELNSYTFLMEAKNAMIQAVLDIGEKILFQALILSYFYSNTLKKNLSSTEFDQLFSFIKGLTPNSKKNLKLLCQIPFTLDLGFRTHTTNLYLKLIGLQNPRVELQSVAAPDARILSYTGHLAEIALQNKSDLLRT